MNPTYSKPASSTSPLALAAWTSFLSAAILEGLVFALVDPGEIHWIGQQIMPSRQGVYTVAFFFFWTQGMICSCLTLWLIRPTKV
jgi:hypothetical protein